GKGLPNLFASLRSGKKEVSCSTLLIITPHSINPQVPPSTRLVHDELRTLAYSTDASSIGSSPSSSFEWSQKMRLPRSSGTVARSRFRLLYGRRGQASPDNR